MKKDREDRESVDFQEKYRERYAGSGGKRKVGGVGGWGGGGG